MQPNHKAESDKLDISNKKMINKNFNRNWFLKLNEMDGKLLTCINICHDTFFKLSWTII